MYSDSNRRIHESASRDSSLADISNVQRFLQIIYAEDVAPGIKAFGFSMSGGYDMDGNIYPGQSGDTSLARPWVAFTFFLKKVLFVGPQAPLFWTSGDVSPGFQINVGSPHVQACHLHAMDLSYSPLVWHLPTSWWPVWQLIPLPTYFICHTSKHCFHISPWAVSFNFRFLLLKNLTNSIRVISLATSQHWRWHSV